MTVDGTFGANHIAVGESSSSFTQESPDIAYVSFGSLSGDYIYDKVPAVDVTTGKAGTFYFCLPEFSLQNGFAFKAFDSDNRISKGVNMPICVRCPSYYFDHEGNFCKFAIVVYKKQQNLNSWSI